MPLSMWRTSSRYSKDDICTVQRTDIYIIRDNASLNVENLFQV